MTVNNAASIRKRCDPGTKENMTEGHSIRGHLSLTYCIDIPNGVYVKQKCISYIALNFDSCKLLCRFGIKTLKVTGFQYNGISP
jgi:hypothetical protein